MRLRFKDNLGSRDAERFGVDFLKCTRGATGDFDDKTAEALVKFGIAEPEKTEGTAEETGRAGHAHRGAK